MPSLSEVWLRVYNEVAISLSERRIWLEPTYLLRIDDDHATVSAPNIFVRNRLATHYHDQLATTLSTIVGRPLRVEVVTESSAVGRRLCARTCHDPNHTRDGSHAITSAETINT